MSSNKGVVDRAYSELEYTLTASRYIRRTRRSTMRVKTLEIRWHEGKPITSCDFQPSPALLRQPRNGKGKDAVTAAYRFATGGEDNNVRVSSAFQFRAILTMATNPCPDMDATSELAQRS